MLSTADAKAIVTVIRDINTAMDTIIQKQVELSTLLCAQVDKPVDNIHHELLGTSPKPSKKPRPKAVFDPTIGCNRMEMVVE